MAARITDEEINSRLSNKRNSEYLLDGPSNGIKTKTRIKHITCGNSWEVVPHDVIRGVSTCPKCAVAKRRTIEEANVQMSELTSGEYEIVGKYSGVKTKAEIRHKPCGYTWDTIPHDINRGASRCLNCTPSKDSGFDKTKPASLYFLSFTVDSEPYFKIGITNRTVEARYSNEPYPFDIIWQLNFDKGIIALELEKYFLNKYKSYLVNTKALISGNYETISKFIELKEATEQASIVMEKLNNAKSNKA